MADSRQFNDAPTLPMRRLEALGERTRAAITSALPLRILIAALLALLVVAALLPAILASRQPHPTYATARLGDVILSVHTSGTLTATQYQADFPVEGTLREIDVTVGQTVKAGDTLAKLDVAPFQNALVAAQGSDIGAQRSVGDAQSAQLQAQAAVNSASASLAAHQTTAATACAVQPPDPDACDAAQAALAQSRAQLDAANARFASVHAQATQAQASEAATRAQVSVAQAQLAAATITAPHAGVITSINGAVGGKPGVTASGAASFITILDTSAPLVTASVSYRDVGMMKSGQAATFKVSQASTNAIFTGVVTGVAPVGRGSGDALSYPVYLKLDPGSLGGAKLLPGMTADTRIITNARFHVVVITNDALTYARKEAPANGSGLLTRAQINAALASARASATSITASGFDIADDPLTPTYLVGFAHNRYIAIPVVLGLSDGQITEVVNGLTPGQQVVNGQRNLFFG